MRRGRFVRQAVVLLGVVGVVVGLAAMPANAALERSGAAPVSVAVSAASGEPVNCPSLMRDTAPRRFDVSTLDSAPAGGSVRGYVWVDRNSSGGYNHCVGWINAGLPYPWAALVVDNERGNVYGAVPFITYISGGHRYREYLWDNAVRNGQYGFGDVTTNVSSFYVGVCLIDWTNDGVRACNDER